MILAACSYPVQRASERETLPVPQPPSLTEAAPSGSFEVYPARKTRVSDKTTIPATPGKVVEVKIPAAPKLPKF